MTPSNFSTIKGDATLPSPIRPGSPIIIPHVCNNVGGWGAGFTGALTARWPFPENEYRKLAALARERGNLISLGQVQMVPVGGNITVANMLAQHGINGHVLMSGDDVADAGGRPQIRYGALLKCMEQVAQHARTNPSTEIHCPCFGSGLAGGSWPVILQMIWEVWCDRGITVRAYHL